MLLYCFHVLNCNDCLILWGIFYQVIHYLSYGFFPCYFAQQLFTSVLSKNIVNYPCDRQSLN